MSRREIVMSSVSIVHLTFVVDDYVVVDGVRLLMILLTHANI